MDIMEIFSNPIVWAFLVWVFSRIFTNKNKEEENKSKAPNQHKNQPRQSPRSNPRPVPKPVMTTVETRRRKEDRRPPLQTVQEAYEKMKQRSGKRGVDVKIMNEQPKQKPATVKDERSISAKRNVQQNHLVIDRNKAAQGVIWSEVLGPPRAKNPHYTKSRRQS